MCVKYVGYGCRRNDHFALATYAEFSLEFFSVFVNKFRTYLPLPPPLIIMLENRNDVIYVSFRFVFYVLRAEEHDQNSTSNNK